MEACCAPSTTPAIILKLPPTVQSEQAWQTATEALLLVVEHNGPEMFARMALMPALYPTGEPIYDRREVSHSIPSANDKIVTPSNVSLASG